MNIKTYLIVGAVIVLAVIVFTQGFDIRIGDILDIEVD